MSNFWKKGRERRNCTKNCCKNNDGFTLVELIIAIGILALIVLPTLEVFVTATKTNSKSRTILQATITAESVIEGAKAYSIYAYHQQCNASYDSTGQGFSLIAGTTSDSFASASYGGTVGTVVFDSDNKTIKEIKKGVEFVPDKPVGEKYCYVLNGIKQSRNEYDAIVVFEKQPYAAISVGANSFSESSVSKNYSSYNKTYSISVYIYKHDSSPEYIGEDITLMENSIHKLTGSKLDTGKAPSSSK